VNAAPNGHLVGGASSRRAPTDTKPWYRQFWPWFVISLPASAVVFSFATLYVAVSGADSLVRDDYYDAGLAINRDFDREREAVRLGLRARFALDDTGGLVVSLEGQGAGDFAQLSLQLDRPNDATRDLRVDLDVTSPGRFVARGALPALEGRWDASLSPVDATWRLASRVELTPGIDQTVVATP
jgi:hypothetical protein